MPGCEILASQQGIHRAEVKEKTHLPYLLQYALFLSVGFPSFTHIQKKNVPQKIYTLDNVFYWLLWLRGTQVHNTMFPQSQLEV